MYVSAAAPATGEEIRRARLVLAECLYREAILLLQSFPSERGLTCPDLPIRASSPDNNRDPRLFAIAELRCNIFFCQMPVIMLNASGKRVV